MITSTERLAALIRGEGIRVKQVEPMHDEVDGVIYLGDKWHVQVGPDYLIVMEEMDERFNVRFECDNVPTLLAYLRRFKSEIY